MAKLVKYEYRLEKHPFNVTPEEALKVLNDLGAEGWRLFHDVNGYALFIREVESPAPETELATSSMRKR